MSMNQNTSKFHNYWPEGKRKNCHASAWLTEKFGEKDFVAWCRSFLSYTALSVIEKKTPSFPLCPLLSLSSVQPRVASTFGMCRIGKINYKNEFCSKYRKNSIFKQKMSENQTSTKKPPNFCFGFAFHHHFLHSEPHTLLMGFFPAQGMVQPWND